MIITVKDYNSKKIKTITNNYTKLQEIKTECKRNSTITCSKEHSSHVFPPIQKQHTWTLYALQPF